MKDLYCTLQTTPEEMERIRLYYETVFFESKFEFLKDQNGLRKSQLHILLGPTGAGKSIHQKKVGMRFFWVWLVLMILLL